MKRSKFFTVFPPWPDEILHCSSGLITACFVRPERIYFWLSLPPSPVFFFIPSHRSPPPKYYQLSKDLLSLTISGAVGLAQARGVSWCHERRKQRDGRTDRGLCRTGSCEVQWQQTEADLVNAAAGAQPEPGLVWLVPWGYGCRSLVARAAHATLSSPTLKCNIWSECHRGCWGRGRTPPVCACAGCTSSGNDEVGGGVLLLLLLLSGSSKASLIIQQATHLFIIRLHPNPIITPKP